MKFTMMQEKILITAESLIQKLGYNGFSYKDIALVVGIKTSSIHYYYPTKEDLAVAVIDWQLHGLSLFLDELKFNSSFTLQEKLLHLIDKVMSITFNEELKMCLGGMLASDVISLPEKVLFKVRSFFNVLDLWLKDIFNNHSSETQSLSSYTADELSKNVLVQLEGGLLLSRLYGDSSYNDVVKHYIKKLF